MARMIVLRFAATCVDCGASLSAGSSARWFGRGRVSCCGGQGSPQASPTPPLGSNGPADPLGHLVPPLGSRAPIAPSIPVAQPVPPVDGVPFGTAPHRAIPGYLPSGQLAQLARDTGIDVAALASGLSPEQVGILAAKTPNQRLIVRLSSGARCIVPALHAVHVARCIGESCIDRVRDIALLADGLGSGAD